MAIIDRQENYGRHLVQNFARLAKAKRVIDLGAGHGYDLDRICQLQPEIHAIGIENHPPYQEKLRDNGYDVLAVDIERQAIPLDDNSIDLVVANQIFEHLKEVFWVCHEIARIVPVGGHLIIGVPNLASLHNRMLLLLGRQPSCQRNWSAHVRGYTKHDLLDLLDRPFPTGWKLIASAGSNFYPFPKLLARPLARAFPNLAWGTFILVRKEREYDGGYLRWPIDQQLETNFRIGPNLA